MFVNRLQSQLENLYEIELKHRVHDYIIYDREMALHLDSSGNPRDLPEKLLICQDNENLELSLYLDRELVNRLEKEDPIRELNDHNIHDFWIAVEGISHFLYVVYNAGYEREISLLELELQAEVDKYILAANLFAKQQNRFPPASLHYHLYESCRYDPRLQYEELNRYQTANRLAGKFSAFIHKCMINRQLDKNVVNIVRRFYRLSHREKIKAIDLLPD